jgi:hypothetical protein
MNGNGHRPAETVWQPHGRGGRRALARLYLFAAAIIGLVGIGLAFYAIFGPARAPAGPWVSVASVTQVRDAGGVWYDEPHGVFVVISGPRIVAFSAGDTASPERVYFCPSSGWFETPGSGSKFDRLGFFREGRIQRGLDRVPARIEGSLVSIRPSGRTLGPRAPATDGSGKLGPSCADRADYSFNAASGQWVHVGG